jgi:hypothetical protein
LLKSDIYEDVAYRLGERVGQEDFWPAAARQRAIERAVTQFCYEERWAWLLSVQANVPLVAGNSEVELIDDVDANRHMVFSVKPNSALDDARTALLKRVTPAVGMKLRVSNVARGVPGWYYVSHVQTNTYIPGTPPNPSAPSLIAHVVPTPSETSTVEYLYFRNPVAETWDDDDELIVPDQYVEAVTAFATGMLWLNELNGGGKAQEQFNVYQSVLDKARREHRALANDDILAWGAEEPQLGSLTQDTWFQRHFPAALGG